MRDLLVLNLKCMKSNGVRQVQGMSLFNQRKLRPKPKNLNNEATAHSLYGVSQLDGLNKLWLAHRPRFHRIEEVPYHIRHFCNHLIPVIRIFHSPSKQHQGITELIFYNIFMKNRHICGLQSRPVGPIKILISIIILLTYLLIIIYKNSTYQNITIKK